MKTRDQLFNVREQEILELLKEGYTRKEIAAKLDRSLTTIKGNIRLIRAKLHARNTLQAVVIAIRKGCLGLEDTGI